MEKGGERHRGRQYKKAAAFIGAPFQESAEAATYGLNAYNQ
jgi:hypothetical protein